MKTIKITKHLEFIAEDIKGRKTPIIHVGSRSSGDEIAFIEWYSPWRQYIFQTHYNTIWSRSCLTDVLEVLNQLMKERTINKPKGE